jgi:hypothetical protein
MTICITAVAAMVAVAAAIRSTWSPCGLSMLSTITPLSERARGHSCRATTTWFIVGATVGGLTIGVVMALLAGGAGALRLSSATLGSVAIGAALVAFGSDLGIGGLRLPIHRRQVNERWLDRYRPWVYGAGFGWQIGTGVATYITTAAVYLMITLGALTTDPAVALALGTGFGALRGLAVLLTRNLSTPTELLAFHRRFAAAGPTVGRAVVAVEAVVILLLVGYVWSPVAMIVLAGVAALAGLTALAARRRPVSPSRAGEDDLHPHEVLRPEYSGRPG